MCRSMSCAPSYGLRELAVTHAEFAKRLDEHGFHWPRIENSVIRLTAAQLLALIDGMDWSRVKAVETRHPLSAG